jgi:transcriptional regulator with XRE-family HTH domain
VVRTTFAEQLRLWREAADISQREAAKRMGRSPAYVAAMETGQLPPPDKATAHALADALGLDRALVWSVAAPLRLQRVDAELYEWHREQIAGDALRAAEERATAAEAAFGELAMHARLSAAHLESIAAQLTRSAK